MKITLGIVTVAVSAEAEEDVIEDDEDAEGVILPSFQEGAHGGDDQGSETEVDTSESEEEREWYVGWRGSDYGEREPWVWG